MKLLFKHNSQYSSYYENYFYKIFAYVLIYWHICTGFLIIFVIESGMREVIFHSVFLCPCERGEMQGHLPVLSEIIGTNFCIDSIEKLIEIKANSFFPIFNLYLFHPPHPPHSFRLFSFLPNLLY